MKKCRKTTHYWMFVELESLKILKVCWKVGQNGMFVEKLLSIDFLLKSHSHSIVSCFFRCLLESHSQSNICSFEHWVRGLFKSHNRKFIEKSLKIEFLSKSHTQLNVCEKITHFLIFNEKLFALEFFQNVTQNGNFLKLYTQN